MVYLKSGHKVVPILGEEGHKQAKDFGSRLYGALRLDPDGWFFTAPFLKFADEYYDFKFRPSDVLIHTFAKSGTTWTQEIIWTLVHNPDLKHPRADVSINVRSPNLEADIYMLNAGAKTIGDPGQELHDNFVKAYPDRNPADGIFLQLAELAEDPRIIKTHLPLCLLSPDTLKNAKMIYVARDPKDVLPSLFDFSRRFKTHSFYGDVDTLVDYIINNGVQTGPYWLHLKQAWKLRNDPNVLFVYFEDLKANTREVILRFAEFLKLDRTEEQINNVVHWTSFAEMKKRDNLVEGVNSDRLINTEIVKEEGGFFNRGKSGAWKEKLTSEQVEKLNKWIKENVQEFDGDFRYKTI